MNFKHFVFKMNQLYLHIVIHTHSTINTIG